MWLDINDTQGSNTTIFEQWNLGTAIETMKATDGLIAKNLPPEYCQFDLIEKIYPQLKKGAGVIQHYQRSRIYRDKV
jgi:subtilisin-like proprotein convertase family protein